MSASGKNARPATATVNDPDGPLVVLATQGRRRILFRGRTNWRVLPTLVHGSTASAEHVRFYATCDEAEKAVSGPASVCNRTNFHLLNSMPSKSPKPAESSKDRSIHTVWKTGKARWSERFIISPCVQKRSRVDAKEVRCCIPRRNGCSMNSRPVVR